MGTAAARALAARGRATTVLERSTVGHANGSSGGPTRNFRLTYHDPIYVRMARASLQRWRSSSPRPRWSSSASWAASTWARPRSARPGRRWRRRASRSSGRPRRRRPSGGRGSASRAARCSTSPRARSSAPTPRSRRRRASRPRPARRSASRRSPDIRPAGDGVEVVTFEGDAIQAPAAIVAAGAWAPSLLADADVRLPLRVLLEQSTVFDSEPDLATIPTLIDWEAWPDRFPLHRAQRVRPGELKVGIHLSGPTVDRTRGRSSPTWNARPRPSTGSAASCHDRPRGPSPRRASTASRPTRTSCSIAWGRSW